MTKAEKFLKDGVSVEDFINAMPRGEITAWISDQGTCISMEGLKEWLNTPTKPTLSEDEKVILKSIKDDNWAIIGKTDFNELYLANYCKNCDVFVKEIFKKDLFQFIQPRRRIQY